MTRAWALVGLSVVVSGCLDRLFYYPDGRDYGSPTSYRLKHEEVSFPSADGTRLSGWFLPAVGEPRGTVVHAHGNAANISNHFHGVVFLPPARFNVLVFDYRGFGRSEGAPTRAGCVADVNAALDYVRTRPDVARGKVGLFGQSLGGALSIVVGAARTDVAAVAAEAAFTSHRELAREVLRLSPLAPLAGPLSRLLTSEYAPLEVVDRISPRPLLLLHGDRDALIPLSMSRELLARAGEPKALHVVEGGQHLHVPEGAARVAYERVLVDFFAHAFQ
ncbi:MAG: alpha/beta hydrolase [Myxococcota bacterium]